MKEEMNRLSPSLEDYLREIYLLNLDAQEARVTDIARQLGISKPSVNRAMNTLKDMEMLEHEHYGTITLTDKGLETAKNILDNYKVIYKFLTEVLDVDEQTAVQEAHLMEHTISKNTRKKFKKLTKKILDKRALDKKAPDKKTPDKKAADKKVSDKKSSDKKTPDKKSSDKKSPDKSEKSGKSEKTNKKRSG